MTLKDLLEFCEEHDCEIQFRYLYDDVPMISFMFLNSEGELMSLDHVGAFELSSAFTRDIFEAFAKEIERGRNHD